MVGLFGLASEDGSDFFLPLTIKQNYMCMRNHQKVKNSTKRLIIHRISGLTVPKYVMFHARNTGDNDLGGFLDFRVKIKDFIVS